MEEASESADSQEKKLVSREVKPQSNLTSHLDVTSIQLNVTSPDDVTSLQAKSSSVTSNSSVTSKQPSLTSDNPNVMSQDDVTTTTSQQQNNLRHRSNNNGGFKKKKRRRRRRRTPKSGDVCLDDRVAHLSPNTTCDLWTERRGGGGGGGGGGAPTPVLRPVGTQVPRAPENSTQFIMDDHENSTLFVDFDNFSTPHWEQELPVSGAEDDPVTGSATPTHALTRDWYPFNQAEFETAYQSAREDRLMSGSRSDLCKAIISLEARAAVLTEALSAFPSRLVSTLQSQLLHLQEENSALRMHLNRQRINQQRVRQSSSSSSTDSDSESDSTTNSSSDCSESDCDTCAARRNSPMGEEEKENTRPSPPTSTTPMMPATI